MLYGFRGVLKQLRGSLRLRSGQAFDCVRLAPPFAQDDKGLAGMQKVARSLTSDS